MKIILSAFVVLAAAVQVKAQTKSTLPFTFKQSAPVKIDSNYFSGKLSKPSNPLSVRFNNFYDPMPVAKLQGNSKMPVVRIEGYDRMPNAYANTIISDTAKANNFRIMPFVEIPSGNTPGNKK